MKNIFAAILTTALLIPFALKAGQGVDAFDAYTYATSPVQKNGAVFLKLFNHTDHDVKMIAADTYDVANTVELHTHEHEDGIMRMRQVDYFMIEEDETVQLEPMGHHIMLFGLSKPLVEGDEFEMTVSFDTQDPVIVDVQVIAPGTHLNDSAPHHDHSHH
ncbi:MAG: copper chaperone PCu(A)C [Pseudomonadota bacterium]